MAYISRDKLNEAFTALRFNEDGTLRHWDDRPNWCMSGQEVEDLINSIPIADVVEKERYDRLLENANILAEAVRKYQTADVPERNVGKCGVLEEVSSAQECKYWDSESCFCALHRPSAQSEQCEFCKNRGLEDGDTLYMRLYMSADWDGGILSDFISDIHYCPKCGRRL